MKLQNNHLELAKAKFEEIKKNKCNVVDGKDFLSNSIEDIILRYTVYLFESYDFLVQSGIKREKWEDFYKLLSNNLDKEAGELEDILFNKYGFAF